MTAINIFCRPNCISILTDGAGYDAQGVLRVRANKCATIPHMSAAIAIKGPIWAAASFAAYVANFCSTFDDLILNAERLALAWEDSYDAQLAGQAMQIMLAGWSESTGKPSSYLLSTSDYQPGMEPGVLYPLPAECLGPVPGAEDMQAVNWPDSLFGLNFRPDRDGLLLLNAQRHMRYPVVPDDEDSPLRCLVGSHVCLTEITKEGISQRVIHRWDDPIGEVITPADPGSTPLPPLTLNRQQRRQAERANRKSA